MRVGIAHHLGWAVAVSASADHVVVDRRRIELVEPGLTAAPVHHEGGPHLLHRSTEPLDDGALGVLVAEVRASVVRSATAAFDDLAATRFCWGHGRSWGRRGPRTTGWRSPRRSSPPDIS